MPFTKHRKKKSKHKKNRVRKPSSHIMKYIAPTIPYKIWIDKSWTITDLMEKCDLLKGKINVSNNNIYVKMNDEMDVNKDIHLNLLERM